MAWPFSCGRFLVSDVLFQFHVLPAGLGALCRCDIVEMKPQLSILVVAVLLWQMY
jgi:hypothetical protein